MKENQKAQTTQFSRQRRAYREPTHPKKDKKTIPLARDNKRSQTQRSKKEKPPKAIHQKERESHTGSPSKRTLEVWEPPKPPKTHIRSISAKISHL